MKKKYINQEYVDALEPTITKYKNQMLTPAMITALLGLLDRKGIIKKEEYVKALEEDLNSWKESKEN